MRGETSAQEAARQHGLTVAEVEIDESGQRPSDEKRWMLELSGEGNTVEGTISNADGIGTELVLTSAAEGMRGAIGRAEQIAEVEDVLAATLRFENGSMATITATTTASPGFPHRVEIYGTGGGVQVEGARRLVEDPHARPAVGVRFVKATLEHFLDLGRARQLAMYEGVEDEGVVGAGRVA